MSNTTAAFSELTTAEEFLDFFAIPYDRRVVASARLVILRRVHRHLDEYQSGSVDDAEFRDRFRESLARAYAEVAAALTAVTDQRETPRASPQVGGRAFVPLDSVIGRGIKRQ